MRELVSLSILVLGAALLGCQAAREWKPTTQAKITGSVSYVQKVALPPNSTVELRLEDVSRPDAPAILIAKDEVPTRGRQVPIAFELKYDSTLIQPSHRYAVRADIVSDGAPIFAAAGGYPVITGGAPVQIAILVEPAGKTARKDATMGPTPPLVGTYWRIFEINGATVVAGQGQHEPHLVLRAQDQRIDADGGLNLLTGTYELRGESLRFGELASTLMAGPSALMNQEKSLQTALRATTGYRVNGRTLQLLDGDRILVRLEAAEPP